MLLVGAPLGAVVRNLTGESLGAATPCSEYDVRGLVNHLLFWGPSLEGAGRKESVPPPAASEGEVDLVGDGWVGALAGQVGRTVEAWGQGSAWEGLTWMGGAEQIPAAVVGGMVVAELVVHGWDLARATGQVVEWDAGLVDFLFEQVSMTAQQGREMGVYGEEVVVSSSASTVDRVLGLTGRDPGWTARL
ncbi:MULTISPECIES: TIGR03086 family metal-binding protein [unclassified Crossiella]|uniref:TIGR03086 family metal-binding protein n=1 Tax=unclassified Crossiella TaxID=2620835 RepID=UPI001FFE5A42|nr:MULTISPECIES: TIGR03086 family metal-binding protein [unclassified Crossiella]MCK2237375.1 TIGR03086 family metal-binding protein [Crossiella sp. S99.2]MCK2251030.1 TIGR03086 family metal-binding protein [Crossiella sp. S99.1]